MTITKIGPEFKTISSSRSDLLLPQKNQLYVPITYALNLVLLIKKIASPRNVNMFKINFASNAYRLTKNLRI